MKAILFVIAGALFGTGLAVSGMTDPARVIGFLDVSGKWEPALMFVMAGAVAVYGLGMFVFRRSAIQASLPSSCPSPIDSRLLIGAAIFGVGWGLSGFCPGPSIANLGALRVEALVFVPAMAIGMMIAQRTFKADRQTGSNRAGDI